jgi:hypothetical protein
MTPICYGTYNQDQVRDRGCAFCPHEWTCKRSTKELEEKRRR